jgi:hypothetical protein
MPPGVDGSYNLLLHVAQGHVTDTGVGDAVTFTGAQVGHGEYAQSHQGQAPTAAQLASYQGQWTAAGNG